MYVYAILYYDIIFLLQGTDFQRAISDSECVGGSEVKRLVFCSGKVYYELAKERQDRGLTNQVALVRIEQVCAHIQTLCQKYLYAGNSESARLIHS